jgi:aspartyl-tRNA(Asn)/glutamyl-tRNA(Gln) amidotransferase subunit B
MKVTPIIGIEVHVELKTKSKMFCSCDAEHFHINPNTHTCPVCLGLPGALPVPNKIACQWCLKLGLALGCTPNKSTFFERKNYFYPDLAKGYQITQFEKPFVINGKINIDGKEIRINRAHMEEDTGKSVHITEKDKNLTLIDYNRCGVPLVEIVTEPDIDSPEMAKKFLLKIQQIVRYLEISDADIEKGTMRCEPTINLKIEEDGNTFYTPLVEVKNIASLTGAQNAIQYEIDRQLELFKENKEVKSETNKTTRGWDATKNETFLQREKEGSSDYRYFPEPDIPHVDFTDEQIEEIEKTIPEMPDQKVSRYQKDYKLSDYDANLITQDINFAKSFEEAIGENPSPKFAKSTTNLFLGPVRNYLNESEDKIDLSKIKFGKIMKEIFDAVEAGVVSGTAARQIIPDIFSKPEKSALEIFKEKGLIQISDSNEIEKIAQQVINDNSKAVADYKKNPNSIGFLIGQLMKESKGSANPQLTKEILEKLLNEK